MPKISIIVPIYNVEKYLRRCLDSIISQTLKDIEIILATDGPENCNKICEEYAQKAGIDVRVAKRDFLPKFILFGNIGFNAYRWNSIFNDTTFLSNIGIAPYWNIFSGGAKLAHYRINKYEYKKAAEAYEQTMLNSIQEVNNALASAKATKANLLKSEEDYDIETQRHTLATRQFNIGDASKLDELKSSVNLLIAQKRHTSSKIDDAISSLSLYNAVGGVDYTAQDNSNSSNQTTEKL